MSRPHTPTAFHKLQEEKKRQLRPAVEQALELMKPILDAQSPPVLGVPLGVVSREVPYGTITGIRYMLHQGKGNKLKSDPRPKCKDCRNTATSPTPNLCWIHHYISHQAWS